MTTPAPETDNVPINTDITATFDRLMNESTINEDTFTLKESGSKDNEKEAKVSYQYGIALMNQAQLKPSTVYSVTITYTVQDVSGNHWQKIIHGLLRRNQKILPLT
jgi:hypothetical protein